MARIERARQALMRKAKRATTAAGEWRKGGYSALWRECMTNAQRYLRAVGRLNRRLAENGKGGNS